MEIRIFDRGEDVASAAAARIVRAIAEEPSLVLGLPAGRTPIGAYQRLREAHAAGQVDFGRVRTFTLDEFAGIEGTHPASFCRFVREHLIDVVNVSPLHAHFLDGAAPDLDVECRRYETEISRAGGLGLQLLGIGANGHVGFNEPAAELQPRTHRVSLHEDTRRDNADRFGGDLSRVPTDAVTMGMATILNARCLVMIATGARKAAAIAKALEGPLTTHVPASLLQTHSQVEVYLDRGAASGLGGAGRSAVFRGSF